MRKLLIMCGMMVFAAISAGTAGAELALGTPFTHHMVLQRGKVIPVWGQAKAGQEVVVEFGGQKKTAKADQQGKWLVKLDAMEASAEARELKTSAGDETKTLKDVLVGDVWVATGQSNMRWMLKQSTGGKEEVAASKDPGLRLYNHAGTLHPGSGKYPIDFLKKLTIENYYSTQGWLQSRPESSASFSGMPVLPDCFRCQ